MFVEVCLVARLASASLSEASVRLPILSSLTAEGRCGMVLLDRETNLRTRRLSKRKSYRHPIQRANAGAGGADLASAITLSCTRRHICRSWNSWERR